MGPIVYLNECYLTWLGIERFIENDLLNLRPVFVNEFMSNVTQLAPVLGFRVQLGA
jgi:hypothetical protein